jgi:hypothetical protein
MEFKKLLVYLELPEEPKSSLHLDEESKAALEAERMKKYGRLVVYAVGSGINEELSEGDEVMIDPNSAARAVKIPLTVDKDVILISIDDIAHIW